MSEYQPSIEQGFSSRFRKIGAAVLAIGVAVSLGSDGKAESSQVPKGIFSHVVAMGDSYASGLGAENDNDNWCRQSDGGFAGLVAHEIGAESFLNLACGGASPYEILNGQSGHPSQISNLPENSDLVMVTAGGNSVNLRDYGNTCISTGCGTGSEVYQNAMNTFGSEEHRQNLEQVYRSILAKSPDSTVLAVGYPKPIDARGWCQVIGRDSAKAMSTLVDAMNQTSQEIVEEIDNNRLQYVEPAKRIDVCSTTTSLRGLYFYFYLNDESSRTGHLNAKGHEAQADAILTQLVDIVANRDSQD